MERVDAENYPRKFLSHDEERALFQAIKTGDKDARDRLALSFLPLAESIARKHFAKINWVNGAVELDDLTSAACAGLLEAVDHYDESLGNRFATYAKFWIAKRVRLQVRSDVWWAPSITDYLYRSLLEALKVQRIDDELAQEAALTGTPVEADSTLGGLPSCKRRQILSWLRSETISLDSPVGDGESTLVNMIESTALQSQLKYANYTLLQDHVAQVLRTLTPREERVIRLRFGCDQADEQTLEQVARHLKLTPERVRQIEAVAIRKLRHPSRSRKLKWLAKEADCA